MSELLRAILGVLIHEYPLTSREIADRIGAKPKAVYNTIYRYGDGVIDVLDDQKPFKYKVRGFD